MTPDEESRQILALASIIEAAEIIEVASGDREPSSRVNDRGQRWIVDGLRLLARTPR